MFLPVRILSNALAAVLLVATCSAEVTPQHAAAVLEAATRFQPDVTWRAKSVITGDFSCRGRLESAIIGTNASEIVVSIFINGLSRKPEDIAYSTAAFAISLLSLKATSLDFDVNELAGQLGYSLPGLRRSKTCKGIDLGDGETDAAHIYWNRTAGAFDVWRL